LDNLNIFLGTALITTIYMGFIAFILFCFWIWMTIDCINNTKLTDSAKPIWLIVIAIGNVFGALAYYFSIIKKSKEKKLTIRITNILFFIIFVTGVTLFTSVIFITATQSKHSDYKNINTINSISQFVMPIIPVTPTYEKKITTQFANEKKVNAIPANKEIKNIKSRIIKGKFITIGKWKRKEDIVEKYIAILEYSNQIILIELFENGMKIEHKMKVNDIGNFQMYVFENKQIKEFYLVDKKGDLYIKNSVLADTFKKI
jgi:hypothetical protein